MKTYSRQMQYKDTRIASNMCPQCGRPRIHERQLCDKCSVKQKLYYWTKVALKKYPELQRKECEVCERQ